MGKVAHLCRVKIYSNSRAHGTGQLRFGHTTSVFSGNGWVGVSCFGKCPAAVPCATADEESGSNL